MPLKPCRDVNLEPHGSIFDFALIVVPTPSDPDTGGFDDTYVLQAIDKAEEIGALITIVVSTVSPGTDIRPAVYAPVMIQLGQVVYGIQHPGYWLVGTDDDVERKAVIEFLQTMLAYEPAGNDCSFPELTIDEAICAKLFVNFFLTLKISAANAIGMYCNSIDAIDGGPISGKRVCQAVGLDPRVGSMYFKPGGPFGGPCLPRDADVVMNLCSDLSGLADAAIGVNEHVAAYAVGKRGMRHQPIHVVGGMSYREGSELEIESFGHRIKRLCSDLDLECTEGDVSSCPPGAFMIATKPGVLPEGTPNSYDPFA